MERNEKNKRENVLKIKFEYCLPMVAVYLNRQSAAFFIFSNYQCIIERKDIKDD